MLSFQHSILILFLVTLAFSKDCVKPTVPPFNDAVYYEDAIAVQSNPDLLRAALTKIISEDYHYFSYSCVWEALEDTDSDPDNDENIILTYSGNSYPKANRDNGSGAEGWNREHTWPKSHGFPSESHNAYTDIHHLRPCDKRINNKRSDKDFKEGGEPFCFNPYGASLANSSAEFNSTKCIAEGSETSTTFEVPDQNKGDVARMMFYLETRYPELSLVEESTYRESQPKLGYLCTLISWAKSDPVDSFEKRRNDRAYFWQANRNPFIDHPEWVNVLYKC